MIEQIGKAVETALGLDVEPGRLGFTQMALRGIVLFLAALLMVRTGDKRFLAENSAFDVILGLILGFLLVWLHRALALAAYHSHRFGDLINGRSEKVVEQGRILSEVLRKNHVTESDLVENLRLNGSVEDLAKVEAAWLERSGEISVIKK